MITKIFEYTHPLLESGNLRFQFDERNQLCGFQVNADLSEDLLEKMITHLPIKTSNLQYWKDRPSGKLTEINVDVSFEDFYEKYKRYGGEKRNKLRAERAWNRLSRLDKIRAFNYINSYISGLKTGTSPKYPDTYLRDQVWND